MAEIRIERKNDKGWAVSSRFTLDYQGVVLEQIEGLNARSPYPLRVLRVERDGTETVLWTAEVVTK
jgi:hypothetical protein